MARTLRILLQTTTPAEPDNWSIDSFALLAATLADLRDGDRRVEVTARNRGVALGETDPVLGGLDRSGFDELWLFALDAGDEDGLTQAECDAIGRFRARGGGILTTRDHQDMGASLCRLGGIGLAHHFHSRNPEPDPRRCAPDDTLTPTISWPNYHSGLNGDFQRLIPVIPGHELLRARETSDPIALFPAHPHEGSVGPPPGDASAVTVAGGISRMTARPFNLVVAFERSRDRAGNRLGRGVAHSSFHHFCDYNWDTSRGAPSFVTEPLGEGMRNEPRALSDIKCYVANLAWWLAPDA